MAKSRLNEAISATDNDREIIGMQDQVMTRLTHASDQLEQTISKLGKRTGGLSTINGADDSFTDSPSKISFRQLSCSCVSVRSHHDVRLNGGIFLILASSCKTQ